MVDELRDMLGELAFADWLRDALCAQVDTEPFFPEKGGSTREAKRICARCRVTDECLQYALDNDEQHGIWGGLSPRQRRPLEREHFEAGREAA